MYTIRGLICLTALTGAFGTFAGAETFNTFVPQPFAPASEFTMIFRGDVRNAIDTAAMATDPLVNPYAYLNQHAAAVAGAPSASATVSLSLLDGNTVVTFSGPTAITS